MGVGEGLEEWETPDRDGPRHRGPHGHLLVLLVLSPSVSVEAIGSVATLRSRVMGIVGPCR